MVVKQVKTKSACSVDVTHSIILEGYLNYTPLLLFLSAFLWHRLHFQSTWPNLPLTIALGREEPLTIHRTIRLSLLNHQPWYSDGQFEK